ncbi:hypothetical protein E5K00_08405 [Hymenobacter aquaticus]|uniref:Uncharacterized protein n=1 Tax=Hymenobacter aquaticus TaxID=1867101 RepID=A0A4Z0Q7R2_9BACT|nr:hypothetical protein [Hymenobacter aquaticus]TGE25203.1 hypothetical protein E5K00_08405 [Hymenobacter aquaticus]
MVATSTTIGDVTVPNPEFRFVYDVRLSQYPDDPDNLALAKAYQWTNQQIGRELPSVQVLVSLCDAFEFESKEIENRRVLQATYGHGKSHLALALANFFGQPAGSPEVEAVLVGVDHVAPGIAQRLRNFKENRAPYLILRLAGGESDSLSAAVVRGLESALEENPATKDAELGLWFDEALSVLNSFSEEERARTNEYLDKNAADLNLDFGALRTTLDVQHRDGRYRQLIHKVVQHVRKVYPHFDAALSPRDLLLKTAAKFCGPGKPFAGILVLFDEFAAFVEAYAKQYGLHTESLPLQSLLDGVSALRQSKQAVFLAFAQQDPDDVAELAMQERGTVQASLNDLKKELTRLPNEGRNPLYSPMEAVLDAYLKQDKDVWDALTPDDSVADNDVIDAVDSVRNFFPLRYTDGAGWTLDKIRVTMAYGCHPLHPLTTALLCSATLRAGTAARTVLSFVKDTVLKYCSRPALATDGRLCWVRPVELVKYYQHQLVSDDAWKRYEDTLRKVAPASIPDAEAILQGMLLYESAGFRPGDTSATDYAGALAVLTGLPRPTVERTLDTLCEVGGYIEKDAVSETYRFWASGQDGSKVKQTLLDDLAKLKRSTSALQAALKKGLSRPELPQQEEAAFLNTHSGEWAARVILLPREQWSVAQLADAIKAQSMEVNGRLTDAARGYVILPLAANDADVQWFRQHAAKDLEQALAGFAERQRVPPVVIVLPKKAHEGLLNSLLELHVLDELMQQPNLVRNLGEEAVKQRRTALNANFQNAAQALKEELNQAAEWLVPAQQRPGIEDRLRAKRIPRLNHILEASYETVYYRFAPFLGDSARQHTMRTAVGMAAVRLYKGSFLDWEEATRPNNLGRARDLYNKVLRDGPAASWKVVDNSARVMVPKLPQVKLAWDLLDQAVPAGSVNVRLRSILLQLLNPPFGYDPYSLGLLFATWYGVNRHQLTLTSGKGSPLEPKDWLGNTNDFKQILEHMLHTLDMRASRRDVKGSEVRAQDIVTRLRFADTMSIEEAEKAIADLRDFAAAPDATKPKLQEEAAESAKHLEHEVKLATNFQQKIEPSYESLDSISVDGKGIQQLLELYRLFGNPEQAGFPLGRVLPSAKELLPQAQRKAGTKLRQHLTEFCTTLADISSIRGYDLAKQRLAALLNAVSPLGEPDLERRIKDAEQQLEEKHAGFSQLEQDAPIREKLNEAKRAGTLAEWRELLAYLDTAEPQADITKTQLAEMVQLLTAKQQEALQWLEMIHTRAEGLTDTVLINSFNKELIRRFEQFKNTPEAETLKQLEAHAERSNKFVTQLTELRTGKPKTADALRKVLKEYDVLAAKPGLSVAQVERVQQERARLEERFDEQRRAASVKLAELTQCNAAGDPPAQLLVELERKLDFLPDEEKPARDALEKALQRRVAQDKASLAEKAFLDINNRTEQKALLARLQQLLEYQPA